MNRITIIGDEKQAGIDFDAASGTLKLTGRSIPEDSVDFFGPLIEWVRQYGENPQPKTVIDCYLEYFNTSSAKLILDIFKEAENIHTGGKSKVVIRWKHDKGDLDIMEAGKDYSLIVAVPFEVVEVAEEDNDARFWFPAIFRLTTYILYI